MSATHLHRLRPIYSQHQSPSPQRPRHMGSQCPFGPKGKVIIGMVGGDGSWPGPPAGGSLGGGNHPDLVGTGGSNVMVGTGVIGVQIGWGGCLRGGQLGKGGLGGGHIGVGGGHSRLLFGIIGLLLISCCWLPSVKGYPLGTCWNGAPLTSIKGIIETKKAK